MIGGTLSGICCGSCDAGDFIESLFDQWGMRFQVIEPGPPVGVATGFDVTPMPSVFAPLSNAAVGVPQNTRPPRTPPVGDANAFSGDADYAVLGEEVQAEAIGSAAIRDTKSQDADRTIITLQYGDDNNFPVVIYAFDWGTQTRVVRKVLGDFTDVNQTGELAFRAWLSTASDAALPDSLFRFGASRQALIYQTTEYDTLYHRGTFFDLTGPGDFVPIEQAINWSVPSESSQPPVDQNRFACPCLNDGTLALAINRQSGNVYRVNWQASRQTAEWAASDPEIDLLLGNTVANSIVWCYRRRGTQEVCLAKPPGDQAAGATSYYSPTAGAFLPIDSSDLANNRRPTYIEIGPDGEVVYGSNKFVRRVGADGWLYVFDQTVGNSREPRFSVQANAGFYMCKFVTSSQADVAELGGVSFTDHGSDNFSDVFFDDSFRGGTNQDQPKIGAQNVAIARDRSVAYWPRTTYAEVQRDPSGREWVYEAKGLVPPGEYPAIDDRPGQNLSPLAEWYTSDIVHTPNVGPPVIPL